MNSYSVCGLHVRSEFALPELHRAEPSDVDISDGDTSDTEPGDAAADVVVHRTTVEYPGGTEPTRSEYVQAAPDRVFLRYEGVGTFLIQDGDEIAFDPVPDADPGAVRRIVLGPGLATLLHQRGFLVLHGSALSIDGRAVVLLGDSGAGKSTLAAALASRGHRVLADDVTPLSVGESPPVVVGDFPVLKLRPDVAEGVDCDVTNAEDAENGFEKQYYRTSREATAVRRPLGCLYVLTEEDAVSIGHVDSRRAMIELVEQTYTAELVDDRDATSTHFRQCARLASAVPVKQLHRPADLDRLSALAGAVEEDSSRDA